MLNETNLVSPRSEPLREESKREAQGREDSKVTRAFAE
jgi:hypothetical protein